MKGTSFYHSRLSKPRQGNLSIALRSEGLNMIPEGKCWLWDTVPGNQSDSFEKPQCFQVFAFYILIVTLNINVLSQQIYPYFRLWIPGKSPDTLLMPMIRNRPK